MIIFAAIAVCLVIVILQLILQKRGTGRLEADVYPEKAEAEPGEKFNIIIKIKNPSRILYPFVRFGVMIPEEMEISSSLHSVAHPPASVEVIGSAMLWPGQSITKKIEVSASKRGDYRFGNYYIESGDFLGFKEYRKNFSRISDVAVYPAPAAGTAVEETVGSIMGDYSVRRFIFEDPVLISGFREYSGREPMKTISWMQSARSGKLMVNKYDFTSQISVAVMLDMENAGDLSEECFSIARSVCSTLDKKGFEYDFCFNSVVGGSNCRQHYFTKGFGPAHIKGILRQLAMALGECEYSGAEMAGRILNSGNNFPGIIYISAGRSNEREETIKRLASDPMTNVTALYAEDFYKEHERKEEDK